MTKGYQKFRFVEIKAYITVTWMSLTETGRNKIMMQIAFSMPWMNIPAEDIAVNCLHGTYSKDNRIKKMCVVFCGKGMTSMYSGKKLICFS